MKPGKIVHKKAPSLTELERGLGGEENIEDRIFLLPELQQDYAKGILQRSPSDLRESPACFCSSNPWLKSGVNAG